MRKFVILLFFPFTYAVCNMYPGYPYKAAIQCVANDDSCRMYTVQDSLQLEFMDVGLYLESRVFRVGMVCNLTNFSNKELILNREEYSLRSLHGNTFKLNPFVIAGKWGSGKPQSNNFTAPADSTTDYIFNFQGDKKLSKDEFDELVRTDTLYFLRFYNGKTDTLFQAKVNDEKL